MEQDAAGGRAEQAAPARAAEGDAFLRSAATAQRRASDPSGSVWVSANAGSGKTKVLTDRVARLLLAGARPERILCLTYTRAAAAEMTARLSRTLGAWALCDGATLRADLLSVEGPEAVLDAARLDRARTLFAGALETPGGLKIQTIHAFCDAVLRRFPLEAGVSPGFEVLDDPRRDDLARRALERVAAAAETGADDAFDAVAAHLTDEAMAALTRDVLARRTLFAQPATPARIAAAFGLDPGALDDRPMADLVAGLDRAALAQAADALNASGPNDGRIGKALAAALSAPDAAATAAALGAALRDSKGAPRNWDKNPTAPLDKAHPHLRPLLRALSDAFEAARARADAVDAAARALALNRFGAAFLAAFEAEKRARGALDFDDLVTRAGALLVDRAMGAWALYKLDGGLDHILVDEAQDTSAAQWKVVEALAAEFHAGEGARPEARSLFVVGDEKQSIYSFQGAEPRLFAETRDRLAARLAGAGTPLRDARLMTSFRSAPAILRAVDATFAGAAAAGLGRDGEAPTHNAAKHAMVGRVDLWPLLPKDEAAPEPDWFEPVDAPAPQDPRLRLARLLAAEIARWLATGETLPGGDRPVRPGDVMVLVRRRDLLAQELVRQLKQLGVPVAGADRLKVAEDLAVRDLLALARFALTPGDDLTLAALLRSPLGGLDGAALEALALGRSGPLWTALRAAPAHADLAGRLAQAMGQADFLRPYEFFERALMDEGPDAWFPGGGRRALLARLGVEREDALDELLNQALAYEAAATPTLEGFLDWIARGELSIKREMDAGAGAVRVMTVHGAKGLEAPVVILPDTAARRPSRPGTLGAVAAPGNDPHARLAAWRTPKAAAPEALRAAAEAEARAEADEQRRLLYVAMTRAERWLIVCGAGAPPRESEDDGAPPKESWHSLVSAGLARLGGVLDAPGPEGLPGPIRRTQDPGPMAAERAEPATAQGAPTPPDWLGARPAPPPPRQTRRAASALWPEAAAGGPAAQVAAPGVAAPGVAAPGPAAPGPAAPGATGAVAQEPVAVPLGAARVAADAAGAPVEPAAAPVAETAAEPAPAPLAAPAQTGFVTATPEPVAPAAADTGAAAGALGATRPDTLAAAAPGARIALAADAASAAGGADRAAALAKGTAVHALLERLPEVAPAGRAAAAERLLAALAPGLDPAARAAIRAEAEAAMAVPEAAAAFGPGALAEVAVALDLPGPGGATLRVSGRIDRLAVGPDAVLAVDFKTDAAPPPPGAPPPEPYLAQMAAYDAALRALYPGRSVTVALLWTRARRLDALDPQALAAARARLAS